MYLFSCWFCGFSALVFYVSFWVIMVMMVKEVVGFQRYQESSTMQRYILSYLLLMLKAVMWFLSVHILVVISLHVLYTLRCDVLMRF